MNTREDMFEIMLDLLAGEANKEERQRLQAWMEGHPAREKEWNDLCALWYSGVAGGRREEVRRAWARLCRRRAWERGRRRVAVAAAVLVMAGTWWVLAGEDGEETIDAWLERRGRGQVTLELGDGRPVALERPSRTREGNVLITNDSAGLRYVAAVDAAVDVMHRLIVPRGGEYRVALSDGTLVLLDAGSTLRFPSRFPRGRREVWLEGEGYFEVAPDASSPFTVHANGTGTTAVGTSFNVTAHAADGTTAITLVTGLARVVAGGVATFLEPGWRLSVDNETGATFRERVDVGVITAWTGGVFRFDDEPLESLARRLERWYDVPFIFRDESLKVKSFSGGFKRHDSLERVLRLIEEVNDVTFSLRDDTIIIDTKQRDTFATPLPLLPVRASRVIF
jgi:ferric-dicitrate binding protein FerR (iron transport regulator)